MIENLKEITVNELRNELNIFYSQKYRFVTASCADNRDGTIDLFYHFDKDLELSTLKMTVTKEDKIPSITNLYFSAFLVENEIKELYGLNIENINIDYEGKMYMTADSPDEPMTYGANITIVRRDIGYEDK